MSDREAAERGRQAARRLAELECCDLEPGLSDREFERVERTFSIRFADDHRAFLTAVLPTSEPRISDDHVTYAWERPWPHWRDSGYAELRQQVDAPISDVLWHVARGYWRPEWGPQPDGSDAAVDAARERLGSVPRLAPVYAHRYLPAAPYRSGHPVLSIWNGLDIICYGTDLLDYIDREFADPTPEYPDPWEPAVTVPFWRDLYNENR